MTFRLGGSVGQVQLRVPSGALSAGEIVAPLANLLPFSRAVILLDITTLTLPDADDEVDFYIQTSYDVGVTWSDVENIHFTIADNGTTARRIIVVDGAKDGPGRIQVIVGVNPGVGGEIVETVPANTIWKLRSLRFAFVTDGTGANRGVLVRLEDGIPAANPSYHQTRQFDVQIASLTRNYNYSVGTYYLPDELFGEYFNVLPDLVMGAGHRWRTVTGSIQAGDNYSAPNYIVEAWHDSAISTDGTIGDNIKSYVRPLGSQVRIRTAVAGATAPTYAYSAVGLFAP